MYAALQSAIKDPRACVQLTLNLTTVQSSASHAARDGKGILITEPAMQQLAKLCVNRVINQVLRVGVRSGWVISGMSYSGSRAANQSVADDESGLTDSIQRIHRGICDPKSLLYQTLAAGACTSEVTVCSSQRPIRPPPRWWPASPADRGWPPPPLRLIVGI